MKYEFIESYVGENSISLMCRTLEVSRDGYYKWCQHTPSERFEQLVMCTFVHYRTRYGSVRIAEKLNEAGYGCCVDYVAVTFHDYLLLKVERFGEIRTSKCTQLTFASNSTSKFITVNI